MNKIVITLVFFIVGCSYPDAEIVKAVAATCEKQGTVVHVERTWVGCKPVKS